MVPGFDMKPLKHLTVVFLLLTPFLTSGSTAAFGRARDGDGPNSNPRKCERITIPMCRDIGYNMTYMPNKFNHETQEEAGLEVHQFWPLVKIQCSEDLKFFLCSMYAPICMQDYNKPLSACRAVCERAKAGCAPLMQQYGFAWPERMNCDLLPEHGDSDVLCMDNQAHYTEEGETNKNQMTPSKSSGPAIKNTGPGKGVVPVTNKHGGAKLLPPHKPKAKSNSAAGYPVYKAPTGNGYDPQTILGKERQHGRCQCMCEPGLVELNATLHNRYYNRVSTGGVRNCAMSCHSVYFDRGQQKFAKYWIGTWSVLCFVSTLITLLTFLIDMKRFRYPQKPVIYLSSCYMMVSLGYIIRLALGHEEVACSKSIVLQHTTGPPACTVIFLLVYFFGMASSLWWVALSLTWFLAAGLKWSTEAIAKYAQYYHLFAWLIPFLKTIVALATSSVDGDPIAGVCYIGNQDLNSLRWFVLTPLFIYLLLGTSFLLLGFISLFRIRSVIKQQGNTRTQKLERLMVRIGIFSVLYTVPATIVIACYFYEQHFRDDWERSHNCPCREAPKTRPDFSVFMLKYLMCLVVGITSGFWVWTKKALESWKRFLTGCSHAGSRPDRYHTHPAAMALTSKYTNHAYQPTTVVGMASMARKPLV